MAKPRWGPRQPKVLHVVPQAFAAGAIGGGERYAVELSRAMARRTQVRLVSFGEPAAEREGAWEHVQLRDQLRGRRFAGNPASLRLLANLRWAEVVHCHQIYTMATSLAALYGRVTGKPVFATDHGGGGVSLFSHVDPRRWLSGRLWVSDYSRRGIPLGHGDAIVYGGVNVELFQPAAERAASVERAAVFAGRLLPVKGVDYLVESAGPELPVALIGPAGDPAYLERLQTLARGKRVRFVGPLLGPALVAAYQQALCVVLPGEELFSLALLEAMACGVPVICLESSGMREVVRDGGNGFVVPPAQPEVLAARLHWLRQNPDAAAAMGRAARATVERDFTWDAVAERCLAAYSHGPQP